MLLNSQQAKWSDTQSRFSFENCNSSWKPLHLCEFHFSSDPIMPIGTLEVLLVDARGLDNNDFLGNYLPQFLGVHRLWIFDLATTWISGDHCLEFIVNTHNTGEMISGLLSA